MEALALKAMPTQPRKNHQPQLFGATSTIGVHGVPHIQSPHTMKDKILFVDDDPSVLAGLKRQYRGQFQTDTAENGREGLEKIRRDGPYAVVVSDISMPVMDGVEFLSLVQSVSPLTVCIVLTGTADLRQAAQAVNDGAVFQFLTKPCPPLTLAKALGAALRHYRESLLLASAPYQESVERFLGGLTDAVESRHRLAAGHQERVARLAGAIGREMGADPGTIDILCMAARAHDIGMIGVPLELLTKTRPLGDAEMELVRSHSQIGRDLLEPLEPHWPLAEIVYQHHERLDGSGYPDGLMGNDIRLEARILAVADVVDAMRSDRPYRPALPDEDVFWEIESNQGALYDRGVVQACLELARREDSVWDQVGSRGWFEGYSNNMGLDAI